MILHETLTKLGFEEKEARLYVACLELGPSHVLEISRKSGIKRPTAYVLLEDMIAKGWVEKSTHHKKTVFTAKDPSYLLTAIQEKEQSLKEALPLLEAIISRSKERPKISIFEGVDGMVALYSQIYSSPEIWWYSSIKHITAVFPSILKNWLETIKKKKLLVRELLTSDPEDIAYARAAIANDENDEIRIMPDHLPIRLDMAIFGNRVAIFTLQKNIFALSIESEDVAESLRSLYSLAWASATPVEKFFEGPATSSNAP